MPPANKQTARATQAADLIGDPRFRGRVQHLGRLGNRITAERLAQLCVDHGCQDDVERFIDRVVANEDAIRELGADLWPPLPPLRAVPR